jgi:monovalent cation:H+ antiporter-2, CPA2 family
MGETDLVLTLAGGLAAALVCGYVTLRLGLSPIAGYLLAGFAVGPNTPGFVADQHLADQLAEIGVILLMFGVGLKFHLEELISVGRVAVPGALVQIVAATLLGTLIGLFCGWGWSAGLVFGLAISVASTVVLLRILADNGDLSTLAGRIAVGWLVVEDLFTVLILVLLPAVFGRSAGGIVGVFVAVGTAAVKVVAMVLLTLVAGRRVIPWLLERVAATRSRELFTLSVLVLALGIAVGAAKLFGVSMPLGAFLAGLIVGRSEFSLRAATQALPMREAFAVLFFVSVGMLFNPHHFIEAPGLVATTSAVILIGKPLVALAIVVALHYPLRIAISVAIALAQIGEFSFILAIAGKSLGILDDRATNTLVAAAIISIVLNPVAYRFRGLLVIVLRRLIKDAIPSGLELPTESPDDQVDREPAPVHKIVVVGYGPVGQVIARLLDENHVEPVVIELNRDAMRRLASEGIQAVHGDGSDRETLQQAGISQAAALILSSSTMHGGEETIRIARELNPKISILACSTYLRDISKLRAAGADIVLTGEGELALSLTEVVLGQLGATPEQIAHEKIRVRADFFGGSSSDDILLEDRLWPDSRTELPNAPDRESRP